MNNHLQDFPLKEAIVHDPLIVSSQTDVAGAIAQMNDAQVAGPLSDSNVLRKIRSSCVFVVDNSQLVGLFTERDVVRSLAEKANLSEVRIGDVITPNTIALNEADLPDIFTAIAQFSQHQIGHLPIVNASGKILGLLTLESINEALRSTNLLNRTVAEMSLDANQHQPNAELEKKVQEGIAQLQGQMQRSRLISGITLRIHQCLNLEEILSTTVREVQQFLACDRVLLYRLWPDGTGTAVTEAVNPDWPSVLDCTFPVEVFPKEYRELYSQGRVRAIDNIENSDIAPCLIEFLRDFGAKAKIVVPILQQEKVWGLLIAHHCCEPRQWQALEIDLLEQLATHIAIALKQSDLYQQVEKARDRLELKVEERTAELRNSEERFRNLVETTSDWIWEMDRNALYTYVSPKVDEILGFEPATLLGKTPFQLMPPEEAFRLANILGPTAALQEPFICIEQTFLHRDGHLVWIETSAVPFFDMDGQLRGYRGINRDITERKQAQERLRQQALAFENIYDSIVITDLSGKIVDWNPSSERMFGYAKTEVLGQPLGILYCSEDPVAFTETILEEIHRSDRWNGEICSTRRDGTEFICESVVVPLYSEKGNTIATIAVYHDITELKRAETEILRTLEKEKELGELKTRFVTMASHEFRTPLATIFVASDLLKSFGHKFSEAKKLDQLNKIQSQVNNMTQLLEDILIFGKAASGRLEFKPSQFNLETFCRQVLSEIATTTGDLHPLIFNCLVEDLLVKMDRKLMRQILGNLLSNAVKYSPPGNPVCFEVSCEHETVILKIIDEGIGIPRSDWSRIFEVFHRASNVGNISGTGLGLAIVKQAVELHGGQIVFESKVGIGTSFTVSIPHLKTIAVSS